jgi:RimJ/RimL family protein N-acetyltransferase
MQAILTTDRLLLREFVPEDLPAFFNLVTDPDVTRYTGDRGGSLEEVKQGLEERVFAAYRKYGYGRWAVVYRPTGAIIGFAGLKYLDDVEEVDLGYRFFKEYWGQGLATEAARAIVPYGFDRLKLTHIIGLVDRANSASIRVLQKVGFRFEKLTTYRGSEVAWYRLDRPTG